VEKVDNSFIFSQPFRTLNSLINKLLKGGTFMKKRMRLSATCLLLMVFALCFVGSGSAWAGEAPPPQETMSREAHQSIIVNVHEGTDKAGALLIKKWICGIADGKNRTVAIMGQTDTYGTVEYLDARIYLQCWNGSRWVDVTHRTYSDYNRSSVSGSSYIPVEAGYYRVRGVHNSQDSGDYDSQSSVSEAIFIP
jgi:hypothetical protein